MRARLAYRKVSKNNSFLFPSRIPHSMQCYGLWNGGGPLERKPSGYQACLYLGPPIGQWKWTIGQFLVDHQELAKSAEYGYDLVRHSCICRNIEHGLIALTRKRTCLCSLVLSIKTDSRTTVIILAKNK